MIMIALDFFHVSKLQIQIQTRIQGMKIWNLALDSLMCQNYKLKYKYKYENIRCSRNDGMDLALDSFIM